MRRNAPPERWHLVLEALPQGRDAELRLKRLLKAARIIYGFREVKREREPQPDQPTETAERA